MTEHATDAGTLLTASKVEVDGWPVADKLVQWTVRDDGRIPFDGFPLDEIPVASKTGSAQVFSDNSTTAWYASMFFASRNICLTPSSLRSLT